MKKTILFSTILLAFLLFSCGNDSSDSSNTTNSEEANNKETPSIVGTWQQTGMDMGEEIPEEEQEMYEETVNQTVENTTYMFNEDGTFHVQTMMLGQPIEYGGKYTTDGSSLTMNEGSEDVNFTYTVTEKDLTIKQNDEGTILTFTFERK